MILPLLILSLHLFSRITLADKPYSRSAMMIMVSNIIFNYAKVTAQERAAIDTPYCITGLFIHYAPHYLPRH